MSGKGKAAKTNYWYTGVPERTWLLCKDAVNPKGHAGNVKISVPTVRSGEMSREADESRNSGVLLSQPPRRAGKYTGPYPFKGVPLSISLTVCPGSTRNTGIFRAYLSHSCRML